MLWINSDSHRKPVIAIFLSFSIIFLFLRFTHPAFGAEMEDSASEVMLVSGTQTDMYDSCSTTHCYDTLSCNGDKEIYTQLEKVLKDCYVGNVIPDTRPSYYGVIGTISANEHSDHGYSNEELVSAVLYDHPLAACIEPKLLLDHSQDGYTYFQVKIESTIIIHISEIARYRAVLDKAIPEMAKAASERKTDVEKMEVVWKYIRDRESELLPYLSGTELLQAALTYIGQDSYIQPGLKLARPNLNQSEESYDWNVVKIDNDWYIMDLSDDFYAHFGEGTDTYYETRAIFTKDDMLYKNHPKKYLYDVPTPSKFDHPFMNSYTCLSVEELDGFNIQYYHRRPYAPKSRKYEHAYFKITVSYNNKWDETASPSVKKVKVNTKAGVIKKVVTINLGKETNKKLNDAVKRNGGLKYQTAPFYVRESAGYKLKNYGKTSNVIVKMKNGVPKTVKVNIPGLKKPVKAEKSEWSYDPETKIISFSGDRFVGTYKLVLEE